ncbi:MAG: hypothetical protein AB7I27_16005 [Bacteriovoracaceae bacterium]
MFKFLLVSAVLMSHSLFAASLHLKCHELINGNVSRNSYFTLKTIDLDLNIDSSTDFAHLEGTGITSENKEHHLSSYFTDGKSITVKGNLITVTGQDNSWMVCGSGGVACRTTEELVIDTKSYVGTYEFKNSYELLGSLKPVYSVKFRCF